MNRALLIALMLALAVTSAQVASNSKVIARNALTADMPIEAGALEGVTETGSLKRDATASRIDQAAGRIIRPPLPAGAAIPPSLIDEPPAIRRGDSVRAGVRSGLAVLHFDAVVESTARAGDYAEFRNPVTGKTFKAGAETVLKAAVIVGKGLAL